MPSTTTRTSKKRTRHDRQEGTAAAAAVDEDEDDLDLKSPDPKKQNTSKTPTTKRKSKAATSASNNNSPGNGGLVPADASTKTASRRIGRRSTGSKMEANVEEEDHEEDDGDEEVPPPLPRRSKVAARTGDDSNNRERSFQNVDDDDNEDPSAAQETKKMRVNEATSLLKAVDLEVLARSTRGRRFLWCFGLLSIVVSLLFFALWTSVVLLDMADSSLDAKQCREALSSCEFLVNTQASDAYYLQELESQVHYWKKQAKQNEAYSIGYQQQCNFNLQQIENAAAQHEHPQ